MPLVESTVTLKELSRLRAAHLASNYASLPVELVRGDGVWMYDLQGTRYLDFLAGYGAVNFGHCHPAIVDAGVEAMRTIFAPSRAFCNGVLPLLARDLSGLTGHGKVLPMNTGAEAVETGIKLARRWGYLKKGVADGQAVIVVCRGNFHGRTTTICSFSTDPDVRDTFGPYTPGFEIIDFGDIEALREVLERNPNVVAFMVEPIQGEGGVIIPPDGFLRQAYQLCEERNVLLMLDGIQSDFGRTGKVFAADHEGVTPHVRILGKALGGGVYPVSAVTADDDIMEVMTPGTHGSTFGGNPIGAHIARTVIELMHDTDALERSVRLADEFVRGLRSIPDSPITTIRHRGAWIGVDVDPQWGKAKKVCMALLDRGVACKDAHTHTIRVSPAPMVIQEDDMSFALDQFKAVLAA